VEVTESNKHSSLLSEEINYCCKMFYRTSSSSGQEKRRKKKKNFDKNVLLVGNDITLSECACPWLA
jgi:hypothetical protein